MLVAVARVKNEADIIEAFARHSACHFDKLMIMDHASSDATVAILGRLIDEGLPIELSRSDDLEPQGAALTRLMRRAFSAFDAQWVVPLDADEFIEVEGGARLAAHLPRDERRSVELFWRNFMYVPTGADNDDLFDRMVWRSTNRSELPKVAIPRSIGIDPRIVIYEGSHFVARDGAIVRGRAVDDVRLCHFPIRSLEQYRLKVVVGTLRYIIDPAPDRNTWGWHYEKAYGLICTDRVDELEVLMRDESIGYSAQAPAGGDTVLEPFVRLGGPLRYTDTRSMPSTVASLAVFAEKIARDLRDARTARAPVRLRDRIRLGWR